MLGEVKYMRITNPNIGIYKKDTVSQVKIENGQIISGKIIKYDKKSQDAVLKLMSGEEIKVKIQGTLEDIPLNTVKLKIVDISESQIRLKLIEEDDTINISKTTIKDNERLIKIINHNIPLTKENIQFVDSLENISKDIKNIEDLNDLLKNLLLEKGVDLDSESGIKAYNQLKGLALEFKNLSLDDILNLIENDIELTGDNIKSYNRLFKEPSSILKDIEILRNYMGAGQEKELVSLEMRDKIKEAISAIYDKAKPLVKLTEIINKDNINIFSKNLNDFKVYSSISNNYYYIDTPLKYMGKEYQFKLIIKDDRKNGQIIDKEDVSIAASVKTKNLGTVDMFLKIKNKNMDININAEKKFISFIKSFSPILQKNLNDLNYSVKINVDEKKEELNLTAYNNFFEGKEFNSINIYV
jgi:hypothetical protein